MRFLKEYLKFSWYNTLIILNKFVLSNTYSSVLNRRGGRNRREGAHISKFSIEGGVRTFPYFFIEGGGETHL